MEPLAYPILACPGCTYSQFMPTWCWFAVVRLLLVVAIAGRRLDIVRVLGLFLFFEMAYWQLWKLGIWFSHPGILDGGYSAIAMIGLLILISGIPAALLLKYVSRFAYFRGTSTLPFTWKRAITLIPVWFGLAVIESAGFFRPSS
jgi:hypothetical protein